MMKIEMEKRERKRRKGDLTIRGIYARYQKNGVTR
jgi:hypothetical protein